MTKFEKANRFYSGLLPEFNMTKVNDCQDFLYHVGARMAIGVRRCDQEFEQERFEQYRVGLHHLCLRAKSNDDVDKTAELAASLGAKIICGPEEHDWAPGYYYVLFKDQDGMRLAANHLSDTGLLNSEAKFGFADDCVRDNGKDIVEWRLPQSRGVTLPDWH